MLSMSEYGDRRVLSGKIKADQIAATGAWVAPFGKYRSSRCRSGSAGVAVYARSGRSSTS